MICERCGHEITRSSSSVPCPVCGTVIRRHSRGPSLGCYMQHFQNWVVFRYSVGAIASARQKLIHQIAFEHTNTLAEDYLGW